MKKLIATLAVVGLATTPVIAATTHPKTTTKTMVTKGADEKATTTVTTKVTPLATKSHASAKAHHRATPRKAAMAKTAHKPVKTAKATTKTTSSSAKKTG